ncbi:MAG: hypothetical protein AB7G37_20145 [Solirubrobacteraceae bacterium]
MPQLILGIDASPNRLGWGLVTLDDGSPIGCGWWAVNLRAVAWRQAPLTDLIAKRLGDLDVSAVYVERPAIPRQYQGDAALDNGRALQAAVSSLRAVFGSMIPLEELRDATWKSLAGVGPKKAATIDHVRDAVDPPWPTRQACKPHVYMQALLLGFDPEGSQDAADAACIAVAGYKREVAKDRARGVNA